MQGLKPDAADAGLAWLGRNQTPRGWADGGLTSAFVLLQLGRLRQNRVDIESAFISQRLDGPREDDAATRWAWKHARLRCGRPVSPVVEDPMLAFNP